MGEKMPFLEGKEAFILLTNAKPQTESKYIAFPLFRSHLVNS